MSLLELLVVLMMVSMLATLLIQGFGFFLGKFETVQRVQRDVSENLVRRSWFVTTVKAMIPYADVKREFTGDPASFRGMTMQPLASPPGRPALISWSIVTQDVSSSLIYKESDLIEWPLERFESTQYSFRYADSQANWYANWPPLEFRNKSISARTEKIPSAVKLVDEKQDVHWYVNLTLFPAPVTSFKQE